MAPDDLQRYQAWAETFNGCLDDDEAWDADPWARLATLFFLLKTPDPWPGTNAEWREFFDRACDRFNEQDVERLSPGVRALLMMFHPCNDVVNDDGDVIQRF